MGGRVKDEGKEEREEKCAHLCCGGSMCVCVCVHSMKGSRSKGARINLIGAVFKLEKGR